MEIKGEIPITRPGNVSTSPDRSTHTLDDGMMMKAENWCSEVA
jgi:hypothetical protein